MKADDVLQMEVIRNPDDISGGVERVPIPVADAGTVAQVIDFIYVRHNIPGPDRAIKEYYEQFEGCKCKDLESCSVSCPCVSRFGVAYNTQGKLTCVDPYKREMRPVLECNKRCQCKSTCFNRVVQNGVSAQMEVFQTDKKGFGLRAAERILQNSFVCEYAGELLTSEVARERLKKLKNVDLNYLLVVHEGVGKDSKPNNTYVDPTFIGNVGRFVNHSCSPNLYMVPVRINNNIPHIALFALRDISCGEELTYDYSGDIDENNRKCVKVNGHVGSEAKDILDSKGEVQLPRKPCHCGAKNCRGFLPFDSRLFDN